MYAFSRYATLTATNDFVSRGHIMLNHWWLYYYLHPLTPSVHPILVESSGSYGVLVKKTTIKTLVLFFLRLHQWRRKNNNLILGMSQPEDGVESNFEGILWPLDLFLYGNGALLLFTTTISCSDCF